MISQIYIFFLTGFVTLTYLAFGCFTVIFWVKTKSPEGANVKGKFLYYHGLYFMLTILVIFVLTIIALGAGTLGGGLIRWVSLMT